MSDANRTLEDRLEDVCKRLERVAAQSERTAAQSQRTAADSELHSKQLLVGDQMMRLLEGDNRVCLEALRALAKKLGAEEVEAELVQYIHERTDTLRDIRETLKRIEALPPIDEPTEVAPVTRPENDRP